MMAVEIVSSPNDTLFFSYSNIPTTSYDLPDGQKIEVGADRFKIPDIIFNPSLVQTIPGMESFAETAASLRGLPQMLAGGTASMQQLKERLEKDLLEESPQAARVKVLASGNATERRFRGQHIGISWFLSADVVFQVRVSFTPLLGLILLLASKSTPSFVFFKAALPMLCYNYSSLLVSTPFCYANDRYEEHGASYVQRKCP
ncbi:putative translation initiation factor eIF-2B subunit delta-like [Capsicum annuum]|nr:putative translation initiation factor eIF-2B subunit delta-like [Capsicum annuum]KAF3665586.1 putative translation initiation factor eIF-2B subunit delta-like [Capsicum annuum]